METPHPVFQTARFAGRRVRRFRRQQGLIMAELATMAGFTQQQISQVELGKINTPIETLARIAQALGIRLRLLVDDDTPASPPPALPRIIVTRTHSLRAQLEAALKEVVSLNEAITLLQNSPTLLPGSGLELFKPLDAFPDYRLAACA